MKYFSMFTGIGGFELGIQNAYRWNGEAPHSRHDISDTNSRNLRGWGNEQPSVSDSTEYQEGDKSEADSLHDTDSVESETIPVCVGYSEIDKYAIATYESHFEGTNYGNSNHINAEELPDFDLLVGGFPCQAFSVAGKRKGFDDTRGTLFFDIARVLENKRPPHFVLENVRGLLGHDKGKTFQTILGVLSDLGYGVEWQLLNSKNFGVPQSRERVYIVGHLRDRCTRKVFPLRFDNRESNEVSVQKLRRSSPQPIWSVSDSEESRRKILSGVKIRRFTPVECERLQGFPDNWTLGSDTQRYKQCGNAVTTNVVQVVVTELMECLRSYNG